MVYWITGKKHCGKTTAALKLQRVLCSTSGRPIILDGDAVRHAMGSNADYSDEGRRMHQLTMASFASILEAQGFIVIISCVSPRRDVRKECMKKFNESSLIYIRGGTLWPGTTYDEPGQDEPHQTYKGNEGE